MKTLLLLMWFAAACAAQEWKVRAVSAVSQKGQTEDGVKATLRIDANTLVCDLRNARLREIPLRSITYLSHDAQARNRAAEYGDSGRGGSCSGNSCAGDLLLMAVLAPFHARWEYVTISWRDSGVSHTTIFRFNKSDFAPFEREMVTRTRLSFEDGVRQRDATRQEIERRKSEALPLRLDRGTFIRHELVNGGLYQMLMIEREPGTGDLFLFPGKQINWKKPVWVIPVTIVAGSDAVHQAEAEYSPLRYGQSLEAVRIPGRVVRIVH